MRPLILCGGFAVAFIVGSQLYPPIRAGKLTADERQALTKEQADIVKSAALDRGELDQLFKGKPESLNRLAEVKPFLAARPPVWPVLLAAALFLYLWWLATLIFDLPFVWQRYVRGSVAHDRLKGVGRRCFGSLEGENGQAERCRKKPQSPAPA